MRSAVALSILGLLLVAPAAQAGVPRSCIHPQVDPVRCAAETRRIHRDVLPSARLRALDRLYERLARIAPHQDRERNRLLREILETLRVHGTR